MNHSRSTMLLLSTAAALLFASCGNNTTQSTAGTDTTSSSSSTSTTTTAETKPAATLSIVTTPQTMLIVRHKVANFSKWKSAYDSHDSARTASGVHSYVVARGDKDSNMVMVAMKVDDIAKAKEFQKSASLKQAMQKGGVVGTPTINFTTAIWQDTSNISTNMRSMTTMHITDWDKWKRVFDSTKQTRMDNGIQERVLATDPDDKKKVILVVAITDSAKAFAFWKSDNFKQIRARSGSVGEPERFIYHIVQRY